MGFGVYASIAVVGLFAWLRLLVLVPRGVIEEKEEEEGK